MGRPRFPFVAEEVRPGLVLETVDYRLLTTNTDHGLPGLAWCLEEKPRAGLFHPEKATALGVEPGPDFGRLQRGDVIVTARGNEVTPEEVMEPERQGRKIVVTGDTRPSPKVIELARGASVLVHDSTYGDSEQARALETGHSTAREAAEVARASQVSTLVLTHTSSRHHWRELRDEAREIFPDTMLPRDFDTLVVPFPEKGSARLQRV
jgi:ribonuclease Z